MNSLIVPVKCKALSNGLQFPKELSYEEWQVIGNQLRYLEGAVQWWVGDWLNYGEKSYGEKYTEVIEGTGYEYQSLANIKSISSKFKISRRRENLTYSHHAEVASFEFAEQEKLLNIAEEKHFSIRQFRDFIKKKKLYKAQGTGENEWYTPAEYIEMVREVMGAIDLDPASNEEANKVINATKYFDENIDGLSQEWRGKIWLNPPYSRDLMPAFVEKLVEEYSKGNTTEAMMVSHNNTDTKWFHLIGEICTGVCFVKSRIKFYKGEDVADPVNGQVFFYLGDNLNKFYKVFSKIGLTMEPFIYETS